MNRKLTLGSLFDGIGGFPLAGKMAGITPVWASEIEPFPIRVTEKRLPEMKHYGDVHGLKGGCRGVFDADEAFEDAAEILPMLRGQGTRHVFPHRPSWIFSIRTFPHFSNNAHSFIEKPRTAASQPGTLSRDGKILTGRAEGNNIYRLQISTVQPVHVSVVFHFGQPRMDERE